MTVVIGSGQHEMNISPTLEAVLCTQGMEKYEVRMYGVAQRHKKTNTLTG